MGNRNSKIDEPYFVEEEEAKEVISKINGERND